MAVYNTNVQSDFTKDLSFFYAGPSSVTTMTSTQLILTAPNGDTQIYGGSFSYSYSGGYKYLNFGASYFKSIAAYASDGFFKASLTKLRVAGATYKSFGDTGNGNGLKAYFFRGNDNMSGSAFNDNLWGYKGNDTINGGDGIDTLVSGEGNDTYIIDTSTDTITELPNQGIV